MLRFVLRFVGATALALIAISACAADTELSHSFKFTIASRIGIEMQGKKQKIDADTVLHYTWKQRGSERTLSFDSALVKAGQDGNQVMNTFISRAKLTNTENGKTEEVPFEKSPDKLKEMLLDSFGVPVCKLQVDENGKEVKRAIVAGPGAKDLIDHGMIANARLFHAPFMRAQDEWSAATEISMGNGGYAKGELTYKKAAAGKGGQPVKVSGTLTNEGFKWPGKPLTIKKAKYVIKGEQTYDPIQGEWISGNLVIDVSFEMTVDDKPVALAKGTIVVSLDQLPGKK